MCVSYIYGCVVSELQSTVTGQKNKRFVAVFDPYTFLISPIRGKGEEKSLKCARTLFTLALLDFRIKKKKKD